MAFVFMLSIAAVTGVESKGEEQETLLAYLIDSGEITQEMVHTSNSCSISLSQNTRIQSEIVLSFDLCFSIGNMHVAFIVLHQCLKCS